MRESDVIEAVSPHFANWRFSVTTMFLAIVFRDAPTSVSSAHFSISVGERKAGSRTPVRCAIGERWGQARHNLAFQVMSLFKLYVTNVKNLAYFAWYRTLLAEPQETWGLMPFLDRRTNLWASARPQEQTTRLLVCQHESLRKGHRRF